MKLFQIDDFRRNIKDIEDGEQVRRYMMNLGLKEDAARIYAAGYMSAIQKVEDLIAKSYVEVPD